MGAGLQCPGCGHVHPAGLPEIARGDATFRCYGCYRTLSVPDGWTGRPATRPAPPRPGVTVDAPAGAGTRDARRARLAGRGGERGDPGLESSAGATGPVGGSAGGGAGAATQMVPAAAGDDVAAPRGSVPAGVGARPPLAAAGHPPLAEGPGAGAVTDGRAPLGWVAPRRSGRPVPAAVRALVWILAFSLAFVATVIGLKETGVLSVSTAIGLYAGTGVHRFGVLLVVLPLWALLSAVIAHFTLEALARRRRPRPASRRSTAGRSTPA